MPFAQAELKALGARITEAREDALRFLFSGPRSRLLELRRCTAVYRLERFDVPRPKALLGDEHFRRILATIHDLRMGSPPQVFRGFRFGAAGSDSPVFLRLAAAIAAESGLEHEPVDGELLLRIRRAPAGGWELLARLTPRPLSARDWRQCNRPGGLNATVAVAGHDLLGVAVGDRYLNVMCGSGTLLVERALAAPAERLVACDIDATAVECAARNAAAAGIGDRVELEVADARALPYENAAFDRLSADLPWGDAVGGHRENAELYPRFLAETARVASPAGRMMAMTHELRLFDAAIGSQDRWRMLKKVRVFHGGHRPGLYLLERRT